MGAQRESSKPKEYLGTYVNNGAHSKNNIEIEEPRNGPYFDKSASKNVTALLGKTAYLNCRVKNLGNKTVSAAQLIRLQFLYNFYHTLSSSSTNTLYTFIHCQQPSIKHLLQLACLVNLLKIKCRF